MPDAFSTVSRLRNACSTCLRMSPTCTGLPFSSTDACPAQYSTRLAFVTSMPCEKPYWSCHFQGLTFRCSTFVSSQSERRERIVALLERLIETVRQAAVAADVALADEPLATDLDELGVLAALLVEGGRLADALVRDAGPDHVRLRAIAFDLDDGVRQQHAV